MENYHFPTLSEIFSPDRIEEALIHLEAKKDTCGADGVFLSSLREYWSINGERILSEIFEEKYEPSLVRLSEIINANGRRRMIACYTSKDRLIQRCLSQYLQETYDSVLSPHAYAYRNNLGIEAAVKSAAAFFSKGYLWTARIDIREFFDSIDQKRLCDHLKKMLYENASCRRLIEKYIHCKSEMNGEIRMITHGLITGSPLSPFLSNLYLSDLDQKLSNEGFRFCRYSDDICAFFITEQEAGDGYSRIRSILDSNYSLQVREEKSGIYQGLNQSYLGYSFRKAGKIVEAFRKEKKSRYRLNEWNRNCIELVDRNYHIINNGILTRRDYNILFENENGKQYIPVETAGAINIHTDITISGNFFRLMEQKRLNVNFFDKYGNPVGYFESARNGTRGKTMLKQAALYLDDDKRLQTARSFELGALHNLRSNLRYYYKSNKSANLKDAIDRFSEFMTKMNEAKTIQELMTIEARARQLYFQMFNEIIHEDRFQFIKRTKMPPRDPLNSLISFGNTYIYNRVATEIAKTSLDLRIGFLHSLTNRNQSLNLDIAEIFKPLIVDRTIFTLVNKRMINVDDHFEKTEDDGIYLNRAGKRLFIKELDSKIYSKRVEGNRAESYDNLIRNEIMKIYRLVWSGEKYKPYKYK